MSTPTDLAMKCRALADEFEALGLTEGTYPGAILRCVAGAVMVGDEAALAELANLAETHMAPVVEYLNRGDA